MGRISDFAAIISMVAASSGFVLAWIIYFQSGQERARRFFLTFYLISICLGLAEPFLQGLFTDTNSFGFHLLTSYTFSLGPLLFLYCKSNERTFAIRSADFLHFLPFCLYALLALFFQSDPVLEVIIYELFLLHVILYCAVSVILLPDTRGDLQQSPEMLFDERFARILARASLVLFSLVAMLNNLSFLYQWPLSSVLASGVQLLFAGYIFFILLLSHNAKV